MNGQGNYAPQFGHGSSAPPPPFQAAPPATPQPSFQQAPPSGAPPPATPQPPFQQAPLSGAPPPPPQQGLPQYASSQIPPPPPPQQGLPQYASSQIPPPPPSLYYHGRSVSQPVHHPPPVMVHMAQPYMHLNPPSSSNYGNSPMPNPYAAQIQTGAPYPPTMGSHNVQIPQSAVSPLIALAPTGAPSQGQPLYRPPRPPPPGIQHVPTPPPPPPSSFVTVTPAAFMPFAPASTSEVHPPSLPPPPPPPPPSSPPPLPSPPPPPSSPEDELPIVDSEEMADDRPKKDPDLDQNAGGPGDVRWLIGSIRGGRQSGCEKLESFASKEEPPSHLSPPSRPTDEAVRNIETLCKFMVNVGPQFEDLARRKEAGNPHFSFLFGGQEGSEAAIGYEYFQWTKRKYRLEAEQSNHQEQNRSSRTPSRPESPMDEHRASPAGSDMDMDDDADQSGRSQGISELNKETTKVVASQLLLEEQFHVPPNDAQERVPLISVPNYVPSSKESFLNLGKQDGDEHNAHHVSASSPVAMTSTLAGNMQRSTGSAFEGTAHVDISDSTNVEFPRVLVNDGSPFRLIQGYASDDSGGDDGEELVRNANSATDLPSGRLDSSHEDEPAEFHSLSLTEKRSQLLIESGEVHLQHMPTSVHAVESSPASHDEASLTTIVPGLHQRVGSADDVNRHQKDVQKLDRGIVSSGAPCHSNIAETDAAGFSQRTGEFSRGKYATKDSNLRVDEFGRMIRDGASSSDSEEMPHEKRGRRGRSRSRSRSPQQRRRSRSPRRWRGRQSPSQSWSPRRQSRSKSPPLPRHMGERARRNNLPPECIHFLRGRCYRGASCWFLHNDSGRHRNRLQDHRDMSKDSENYVHSDVRDDAKNVVKETSIVHQENFPLKEETQELQSGSENYVHSDVRDDAKNVVKETSIVHQENFPPEEESQELQSGLENYVHSDVRDDAKNVVKETSIVHQENFPPKEESQELQSGSENYVHSDVRDDAKNVVKETSIVHQENFPLKEETQELQSGTDIHSDTMDGAPARGDNLDSKNDDAENHVSHEHLPKDTEEVDQKQGSHEVLNQLQESHQAEPKQESRDTCLVETETAQKPLDDGHSSLDARLSNQTTSIPETQHPVTEGSLIHPCPPTVPTDQPLPFFSVSTPISEPQNAFSSPQLHVEPPTSQFLSTQLAQSSNLQSPMPTGQPLMGEIPVSEGYGRPSVMNQSFPNQVPGFHHLAPQPSGYGGGDFNIHSSQTQPPPFQGYPPHVASFAQTQLQPSQGHPPHYPLYASQPPRENWVQTSRTNFLSQPSSADMFPPSRPSLSGNYNSLNAPPPPNRSWVDLPPPSHGKETIMHPTPSTLPHLLHNNGPLGGELPLQTDAKHHHHLAEEQNRMNEFMQRPLPSGAQLSQTFGGPAFIREEQHYLHHPVIDGRQLASSFYRPPIKKEGPVPYPGYNVQPQEHRSFLRDDFHASVGGMPYSQLAHGLQRPTSSNFHSNIGVSDGGLAKSVVPTHYNPFASTFEQTSSSSRYTSNIFGQEGSTSFDSKYTKPFGYEHRIMGEHGSAKIATSPLSAGGRDAAFLAKPGGPNPGAQSQEVMDHSYPWRQSVEDIVQKQPRREPPVGDQYDPLFDSIEPSSKMSKKLNSIQEPQSVVHDTDIASSVHVPADVEENKKQKVGPAVAAKSENDEFGETAPDAEVGAVENGSPVLVDGRDWSPATAIDLPDNVMGDIEIDQVRSPGKSKKSKDSRSMKLFKIALADFVKEVLKPSWRQGNMSKEAFKTIVKKTVDKVSGSVSRHQIPKTQAKINQYVESSQRKLTKLVMGYVDKYVKM